MSTNNAPTYTGSWILASVVTDGGTAGETEEFIGRISEGPTFSNEYETAESNFKGDDTTTRDSTHRTSDIELTIAQEEGLPTLETLGLQADAAGDHQMLRPNEVEIMRVRYYHDKPDPSAPSQGLAQGKEFERVEWRISEDNAESAEHATISLAGNVNGDVYHTLRLPA